MTWVRVLVVLALVAGILALFNVHVGSLTALRLVAGGLVLLAVAALL